MNSKSKKTDISTEISDSFERAVSVSSVSSSPVSRESNILPPVGKLPQRTTSKFNFPRPKMINPKIETALKDASDETKSILTHIFSKNYEHASSQGRIGHRRNLPNAQITLHTGFSRVNIRGTGGANKSLPRPKRDTRGDFERKSSMYFESLRLNSAVEMARKRPME